MKPQFKVFEDNDYQRVCDFFVRLNSNAYRNWNWARWEWMYFHPYFDKEKQDSIGLWTDGNRIVGIALYDLFYGEAFCAVLEGYGNLLEEVFQYAVNTFRNDGSIGFYVYGQSAAHIRLMEQFGLHRTEQTEVLSQLTLNRKLEYTLPKHLRIRQVHFPEDNLAYQTVIWKGFDHEGDMLELDKMLRNSHRLPPHRNETLCLSVVDGQGEFIAHCTCWYDERTDYAYVEPVCVIPQYRGQGLGKAIVCEALNRCMALGASKAYVLSDSPFYKSLGFTVQAKYVFYEK